MKINSGSHQVRNMPDAGDLKNMGPDGPNRKVNDDGNGCSLNVTDSVDVCGVSYSRNDNDYLGCGDSGDGGGGGAFMG